MAEKGFGVKEIKFVGSTPKIDSPNNININAVNVAISTNVSIGGTLTVTGNVSVGGTLTYEDVTNIDSVGLITARNGLNVTAGVSTFADEIHGNNQRLGSLSSSGRFNGLFLNDSNSYYGNSKLFVASSTGFGLEAYGGMDSYLKANSGGGTSGNCYMRTGSSSGGYVFVNGDNGVEIHHAGTSNKKFETTSSGATVTGTLTATTFSGSGASLTSLPAANLTGTLPAISGANLTNLPADTPTNSDIQVVYTVTANGTSAYRFAGNGVVSTADDPDLYLIRGQKYRFINNSGGSHPFQIREASGGTAYSTGVTNNGAASGNIDFAPTFDSPAQIVYQCTSHGGMVGNIYLRDAAGQNRNVGLTTFAAGIDVDGGPINILNGGGAYTTHLNYNDTGINYVTSSNGGSTVFRGSNNNVTGMVIQGSGPVDIDGDLRHLGDTDTQIRFPSNDTISFETSGLEAGRFDSSGRLQLGSSNLTSYNQFNGPGRLNINNNSADGTVDFSQGIVFTDNVNNNGTWTHAGIVCTGSSGYNGNLIFGTDGNGTRDNSASNITEKVRIDSSGNFIVNVTSAAAGGYTYKSLVSDQITSSEQTFGIQYLGTVTYGLNAESNGSFTIKKDGSERLRIESGGKINIGGADQTQNTDQFSVTIAAQNTLDNVARFQSAAAASGTSESLVKIYKGAGYGGVISGYITQGSDHGMKFYTADNGSLTERLRISKPGHITKPSNPAFHARPPANYTIPANGIIGGTWSTGDSESFVRGTLANGNSIWDNSTGIFTVPVTGIYYIHWSVFLASNTTRRDAYIYNGSNIIARTEIGVPEGTTGNNKSVSVSTVVSLTVNDQIKFAALTTGGTTIYQTVRPWSYACADLVG